ncbi:MAG: hypothetical protein HY996_04730 [Micrococcales bacterium]|nr:hypothetical protein [Micrococcales bacterium]
MTARQVTLPSGRVVGMTGLGDPLARRLVLFSHPMPGASGFDPAPPVTRHWGVHLLGIDRPGYAGSPPWREGEAPDARLWALDVASWVRHAMRVGDDASGQEYDRRVGVLGWGAGAVFAAELAAALGRGVDRLALIVPSDRPEPDELRVGGAVGARLDLMRTEALRQGDSGVRGDAAALRGARWPAVLAEVAVPTLVLARADAGRGRPRSTTATELRRVRRGHPTRVALTRAELPIAAHWRRILEHVAPEHGALPASAR